MELQEQPVTEPPPLAEVLVKEEKVEEHTSTELVKVEPLETELPPTISVMTRDDCCDTNPEFAVICSFIAHFGDKIELELDIEQLKSSIENLDELDDSLIDLHVKLLKKVRRYFVRDQWEKALIKFATEYSYQDAYEIESQSYKKTRPSVRIELLRRLLEAQFECDQKFKTAVNLCEATDLRLLPTGRDIKGNTYWQRTDKEGNFRVFLEEPLDYKSWKAACTNVNELNELIDELEQTKNDKIKGEPKHEPYNPLPEIFPDYFVEEAKVEEEEIDVAKKVTRSKKGGRGKKGSKKSLPTLQEVEEEVNVTVPDGDRVTDQTPVSNGYQNGLDIKTTKPDSPKPIESTSIESQVRSTLDSLLSRVVASFSNLIRPLSRNSNSADRPEEVKPVETKSKRKPARREKVKEEVLPRRSSSRIQQLQQKKIAEQEEELKKSAEANANKVTNPNSCLENDSRCRISRDSQRKSESPDRESKNGRKKRKRQSWRRGKGKKKLSWDKDDSDLSSTSSLTESEEEEEEEDLDETFKLESNDYEDEFACEDEETSLEPVIIKRARTARQSIGLNEQGNPETSSVIEEDKPCERCDKSNDPEWILLCDMCDDGYHTSCCLPPLMIVPDGDWFCPSCEHKTLLTKLRELHASMVEILEVKERERKKRQKLRPAAIKKEPAVPEVQLELPKKRERGFLNELNDPIALQAIDNDLDASSFTDESHERITSRKKKKTKRPPVKRRKNKEDLDFQRPRRTYSRRDLSDSEEVTETESDSEDKSVSSDDVKPKARRARASVSYRFQEYDELIQSAIRGSSDEEVIRSESPPQRGGYGRGKDMATIEALAYQQENGLLDQGVANASEAMAPCSKKSRKKSRRLNDLDAESETEGATSDESFQASATEAEEEEDDLTEVDSESCSETSIDELVADFIPRKKKKKNRKRAQSYESDDSEYQPSRTRRAAAKKVSYKESTEDEDTDTYTNNKSSKKQKLISDDDESQTSWKKSPENVIDDDESYETEQSEKEQSERGQTPPLPPPPSPPRERVEVYSTHKVELSSSGQEQRDLNVTPKVRTSLDESIDELALPLYRPKPSNHVQSELEAMPPKVVQERIRDPIQELIHYCSESTTTVLNSYNEALSKDQLVHPPFYQDS